MLFPHIRQFIETNGSVQMASCIANKSREGFYYGLWQELRAIEYPIDKLFTFGRKTWKSELENIRTYFEGYKDRSVVGLVTFIDSQTVKEDTADITLPTVFTTQNKKLGIHTSKGWIWIERIKGLSVK